MANAGSLTTAICWSCSRPAASVLGARASSSTMPKLLPAVIVGGGRVGKALQGMGNGQDLLIGRGQTVPLDFDGPIFVCTRNDDLEAVLQATPPSRWDDSKRSWPQQPQQQLTWAWQWAKPTTTHVGVAVGKTNNNNLSITMNGMLDPWFESKGLRDANQVLAYFAVSKLGEPPIDGKTDTNPEGLTAAYGKWASAVATRLHSGDLSCKVLEKDAFQKQMLEKLIWISAFMLVGARHPRATVGVVEKAHRAEVASLIEELGAAAAAERGIVFEEGMEERLCAYSRIVAHFPTAVKEFKWRNGWFYSMTEKAISEGKPDPCPLHTAWLQELKIV